MTIPRMLSDRYQLSQTLGYGGMSEVHRGHDVRLGREVAIKVLRADLAREPEFQDRFRREAQNAAALNHPVIVAIYDTGEASTEHGTLPYIVMEYVDGRTLRDLVKAEGPMGEQWAMETMADVCAAMDFSHRAGIVHRDVKPGNVMISTAGAVKVMDFGIARALSDGQGMTQTATVIGTAQYLSPEQARGENVDARSDVYAAGCVLYELITGEPPFTGESPVAVAYQHVREDPSPPSAANPAVSPELDAVVLRAMSKNPANRYQSAAEMRSDLVRVLAGQRPQAPAVLTEAERTSLLSEQPATTASYGRHRPDPDEDGDERRGSASLWALAGVVALVVAAVLALLFTDLIGGPPQVTVPTVAGQPVAAAQNTLQRAGFEVEQERVQSRPAQEGLVVRTDPEGGSQADLGSTVTIFVGTGPPQVRVPDVVGMTPAEAREALEDAGLRLAAGPPGEKVVQNKDKVGEVVATKPPAGRRVAKGTPVKITVGVPPETVRVPNVVGLPVDRARSFLQGIDLRVAVERVDSIAPEGEVVGQQPQPGTKVEVGSTVTLRVSRGNLIDMPGLQGLTVDEAEQRLEDLGWEGDLQVNRVPVSDEDKVGVVQAQSPAPGETLRTEQTVTLQVGAESGDGGSGDGDDGDDSPFPDGFPFG